MAMPEENSPISPTERDPRAERLFAWLFPIICWVIATLFLGGNLGKSTDDYSINLRDPVTNAIPTPFNPLERYPFFWRPLHNTMCFGVGTLWPEANRSVHFFVACFHALASLGLYALLRRLTRTRLAPAMAALLFLTCPLHGEVALWFCTSSTAIGCTIFLATALLAMRFARSARPRPAMLGAIFALVLVVACFYEQSAALSAMLPFICFAAAPPDLGTRGRLARALAPTFAAGAACALYILLFRLTAPVGTRGAIGTMVTSERLLPRLHEFASGVHYDTFGERGSQFFRGGLLTGWETLHSTQGLVLIPMLLASGFLWARWAILPLSEPLHPSPEDGRCQSSAGLLMLTGVVTFLAAWLPVFVVDHQVVEMRNTYVPILGAAMSLAGLLDMILSMRIAEHGRPGIAVRSVLALPCIAAVVAGTISLVGYQTFLQSRWQEDRRELAELKRLVPAPPPNSVFVPMRTRAPALNTGYPIFDHARLGVFETPWSSCAALNFAYRRVDIGGTAYNPWLPPNAAPLDKITPEGARWPDGLQWPLRTLFSKDPDGGLHIPWNSMIPFVIERGAEGNQVKLIRRIQGERADHRDVDAEPPAVLAAITAASARGEAITTADYIFPTTNPEDAPDLIPIQMWKYGDETDAQFISVHPWGIVRRATWLAAEAGARTTMSVQMPPLDRPERLLLRFTMADYDLAPSRNPIARVQELVVSMKSDPATSLASVRVDPREFARLKRWVPLVVVLPPRREPAGDRIVITLRNASDAPIRTDPGDTSPIPAESRPSPLPVWVTHGYEQAIVGDR